MQLFGYSLLIFIAFEWAFSESFTIIDNLPMKKVEEKLKKFLDAKKNGKRTSDEKKNQLKTVDGKDNKGETQATKRWWRKKKKPLKLCKTTIKQRWHLCYKILYDNRYRPFSMNQNAPPECSHRSIAMGDGYQLPMFNCEPAKDDQPQYLMGSTDDEEASFYLFKSVKEKGHYNIYVEASITLSEEDLDKLKQVKKEEKRANFERVMNGLTLGLLYNYHND